ncbi:hypothetical protein LMH87_011893 [Akanthomyces muscarius]|uniref:AAA+ ATPase domain-containing protein n=1 Tax=Akanthomyces muscarius TaxID=2231603 RepID=A0A9W8QCP2_AKAMU|nr:hypothetical protein LMH87_011893 [Akanthomyces muscarius]KAJ4151178.1 hypothetical protein LMH87_011893 [Akanthomyces muscarius]
MVTPNYTAPDWFFSDNVKTAVQLSSTKPRIFLADLPNKTSGEEALKHDYTKHEESAFGVSRHTFLSARDTIASCLVRDSHGRLSTHNNGAIIRIEKKHPPEMPTEYVDALAKEFGATSVTLTIHDFQALAATYQDQTPAEFQQAFDKDLNKPRNLSLKKLHPSYELVFHYFGNRCRQEASGAAIERSRQAFATILGVQECKVGNQVPDKKKNIAPFHDHPLIIHVAEAQLLMERSQSLRVVARLADAVAQERKAGKPVILVITGHIARYSANFGDLSIRSGIPASAILSINYLVEPAALDKSKDPNIKVSATFIDNLKFLLRFYARHKFDTETLLPKTEWNLELDDNIDTLCAENSNLLESVAMQITGRACGSQKLSVQDVAQVLNQVAIGEKVETGKYDLTSRHEDADKEEELETSSEDDDLEIGKDGEESETSSEDDDDSETGKDGLRKDNDLNKYEKALHDSIVKVEQLQDTKYEDVILHDDIKDMMKQLILLSRKKIDVKSSLLMSAVQISGALLYGPPGTGKTHLSRAIANSLGSNMLALDSATLTSKYVGETEKYIKAAFSLARKYTPCILFLDEVDALFYRRSSGDKSWQRSALTQFLQEVDGIQGGLPGAPFVLVATNRPMDLDTAFLRRLPQKIHFELPNVSARAQILRVLLNEEDLHSDVDIDHLATLTNGYSGSDLKNLCAEAALLWVLEICRKEAKEAAQRVENTKTPRNYASRSTVDTNGTSISATKSGEADHVGDLKKPADVTDDKVTESDSNAAENSTDHDYPHASSGSEVTEMIASADTAGGDHDKNDGENSKANKDKATDAITGKRKRETARKGKKTEKLARKEAKAMKRRKKKDKKEAEALYMAKFSKVCLTNAVFEKALQIMRPTVSKEAIQEIEKFAKLYGDQ